MAALSQLPLCGICRENILPVMAISAHTPQAARVHRVSQEALAHARQMPDDHLFHRECLLSWFSQVAENGGDENCPYCLEDAAVFGDEFQDIDRAIRNLDNNYTTQKANKLIDEGLELYQANDLFVVAAKHTDIDLVKRLHGMYPLIEDDINAAIIYLCGDMDISADSLDQQQRTFSMLSTLFSWGCSEIARMDILYILHAISVNRTLPDNLLMFKDQILDHHPLREYSWRLWSAVRDNSFEELQHLLILRNDVLANNGAVLAAIEMQRYDMVSAILQSSTVDLDFHANELLHAFDLRNLDLMRSLLTNTKDRKYDNMIASTIKEAIITGDQEAYKILSHDNRFSCNFINIFNFNHHRLRIVADLDREAWASKQYWYFLDVYKNMAKFGLSLVTWGCLGSVVLHTTRAAFNVLNYDTP
jgi:hypothetical protein